MMKIDAFMPFYGSEFFQATQCMTDDIALKYIRCLWYYWSQNKCAGLPDDDDALQLLCRCSSQEWKKVKRVLFSGEFFSLEDGLWHQRRCRKEFDAAMARLGQSAKAAKNRWQRPMTTT